MNDERKLSIGDLHDAAMMWAELTDPDRDEEIALSIPQLIVAANRLHAEMRTLPVPPGIAHDDAIAARKQMVVAVKALSAAMTYADRHYDRIDDVMTDLENENEGVR